MKKYIVLFISLLLVACSSAKPSSDAVRVDREAFALDTVIQLSIWTNDDISEEEAQKILSDGEKLCRDYENMFSKSIESSDVYQLNHANGKEIAVHPQTAYLLSESIRFSELSEGYFDITILPIKELWDFKAENPKVPSQESIDNELKKVDYRNIKIGEKAALKNDPKAEGTNISLQNGAMIDLGGIAKGYIADELARLFKEKGVNKGIINLGGNILMVGEKEPGTPWRVGIQDPGGAQNSFVGSVEIRNQSVVTSGVYERFFEQDGKVYHHLLDPFEGRPADNGLVSVTILSDKSSDGDALSTACFVLGLEKGMELAEKLDGIEAIFITTDGNFHQTSGVEKYKFEKN
ncbi:MAG: FAD:protein FMN transferase [Peptostreptococcaceae bacterium]|nr:FAD:protein FMN transferase [Peptostreptococcaceae bacterium]